MNVLLTGATGLLGNYVVKLWRFRDNLFGIYLGNYRVPDTKNVKYFMIDARNKEALEKIFRSHNIDVVIHAAGEARVDVCEKYREEAYSSNVIGTKTIIELCREYGSKLAYISTNAVFDGEKPPYRENDTPNPLNAYGRIKLECEHLVQNAFESFLIARPILMYGWNIPEERDNTVTWILKKLRENEEIKLVDDIFENPLYALQCADSLLKLIENKKSGIYHIAGKDIISRYQFGLLVAELFGYNANLITPVKNDYFKDIAPRAKNTSYSTGKIEQALGVKVMGIREGLRGMMAEKVHDKHASAL